MPRGCGHVITIAFRLPTRSRRTCLKSPCPSRLRAPGRKFPPRGGQASHLLAAASPAHTAAVSARREGVLKSRRGWGAAREGSQLRSLPGAHDAAAGGAPLRREQHLARNPRRSCWAGAGPLGWSTRRPGPTQFPRHRVTEAGGPGTRLGRGRMRLCVHSCSGRPLLGAQG